MGIKDLVQLNGIVKMCRQLESEYDWGYNFKWDQGTFETAIVIHKEQKNTWRHPESSENWSSLAKDEKLFCPDIIDFEHKIIIEYDETPGKPRHGAKLAKKGHDPDGMDWRTEERNLAYVRAGFKVLVLYDLQTDEEMRKVTKKFLVDQYTGRVTAW